ncbi:uncharacterized protein LOC143465965 isoform X1 [Clavelina lepadiformis]|uniref:uncharacterized protein LOC143465965 isoform X1 n=1 Tax=Clavelina lepadiformis TaxID=159417 RepID=UPI004042C5F9
MPPAKNNDVPTNHGALKLVKASTVVMSTLSVLHTACWASCIVLGVVAIWIRLQFTEGWQSTYFGKIGFSIWASVPFIICGVLSVAAAKTTSHRLMTWYAVSSLASLLLSLAILSYSVVGVANEATVEVYPKRIIVAGITAFVTFIEIVTSTISLITCYRAIGLSLQFTSKPSLHKKLNGRLPKSRVHPSDDVEPGHVTVMALPAKQAAELFVAMYRPFLHGSPVFTPPGMESFQTEEINHFPEPSSDRKHSLQEERRRHRKRHNRRPPSRNNSPDESISGFPTEPNFLSYNDEVDSEAETTRVNRSSNAMDGPQSPLQTDENTLQMHTPRPFSQPHLATVLENEGDSSFQKNHADTTADKLETEQRKNISQKVSKTVVPDKEIDGKEVSPPRPNDIGTENS